MKFKILKTSFETRDQVLEAITKDALKQGYVSSDEKVLEAFLSREKEGTTGFEAGISMPHARVEEIKETVIYIARNSKGVDWPSLDGEMTTCAIAMLVEGGDNAGDEHMQILSKVASALMHEENIDIFKKGTLAKIKGLFKEEKKVETKTEGKVDKYDFVCISTCPTGVAHTNMAAEAMEKYALENNLSVKVERQGATGPVNQLTKEDIEKADYVVVASSRLADGLDRFDGKKVFHCKVVEPIRSTEKVFNKARKEAKVQKESRKSTAKKAMGSGGASPMQALMNGISYMIPFVVAGGILIALSLGFGGTVVNGKGLQVAPHTFWDALLNVGVGGFKLMIPILAGFIASAIAGRSAFAPAMIVSFVVGNSGDQLFDWKAMEFGVTGGQLGFLGAIAVGFFVGYFVKLWQKTIGMKMPKVLKPVEPIIFIPLLITFLTWLVFSFFIYVPIYWLSRGLNEGVTILIKHDLLFLAALILGAMIGFDMGGPVNKIAFLLGGAMIVQGKPEVMGAVAAAIAVPPLGMGLAVVLGKLFRNKQWDEQDKGNATSAILMSIVGITEGAIPFAVKYPKQAIAANMIGSAIGAAVAALFMITDNAQHGGPIVYIVGAIGKGGVTNYVWGLFFLLSILIGGITTAVLMNIFMKYNLGKPFQFIWGKISKNKKTKTIQKVS
ncbi:PTS fructose transporter subunit IIABC [Mycoplasma todarodis]|uniref:PTS fructose transporter subunit IIABC n=1 Tax=Mycoplasma todarodis TaxID=1937191 RepID=A0A4V2NHY8_9MOLU|nr:fructose-specific PTS transporter subunit EIIC [Mycoplasma todarodis]TCG10648.1 hypothetical protein C4B25_03370 [Mycoplasma todarodis]